MLCVRHYTVKMNMFYLIKNNLNLIINQINSLKGNHLKWVKLTTTTTKNTISEVTIMVIGVCFKMTVFSFSDSAC